MFCILSESSWPFYLKISRYFNVLQSIILIEKLINIEIVPTNIFLKLKYFLNSYKYIFHHNDSSAYKSSYADSQMAYEELKILKNY